jgi:hypothetical protein
VEGGLKIRGWMPKLDVKKIKVGMRLKAISQMLPDGNITIVFERL